MPYCSFLESMFMPDHFRDINFHILRIFSDAGDSTNPQDLEDARHVIDKLREVFSGNMEQLGLWETAELNYADRAIDAGFFRLAMISAVKAISIHQLSAEEYAFGFCLVGAQHKSFMSINRREKKMEEHTEDTRINAASILKSNQAFAAQALSDSERLLADKLYIQQQKEAEVLAEHDMQAAERLKADGLTKMDGFSFVLNKSRQRVQELEQLLAMMSGSYSVETRNDAGDAGVFLQGLKTDREIEAASLKKEQGALAENLKAAQQEKAKTLKEMQDEDANDLKKHQAQTASALADKEIVKKILKSKKKPSDKN